jgi:hypothetical protein
LIKQLIHLALIVWIDNSQTLFAVADSVDDGSTSDIAYRCCLCLNHTLLIKQ